MLSFASEAEQTNATFPAVIRIADKVSNSTARIADVLQISRGTVDDIRDEMRLMRKQAEESGDVFKERTSLAHWAAIVAVGTTVASSIVFVMVGTYYLLSQFWLDCDKEKEGAGQLL
jgi:hypothetical protein